MRTTPEDERAPAYHREVVRIPIACTLETSDVPVQLARWQTVLSADVDRVERAGPVARLVLSDGADVHRVIEVAQAEQSCCGFLAFALEISGDGLTLRIESPPDGEPVLAALLDQ